MLEGKELENYWKDRAETHGELTVGFGNTKIEKHDEQFAKRSAHLFKQTPRDLVTLDYGCGIGRLLHYLMRTNIRA